MSERARTRVHQTRSRDPGIPLFPELCRTTPGIFPVQAMSGSHKLEISIISRDSRLSRDYMNIPGMSRYPIKTSGWHESPTILGTGQRSQIHLNTVKGSLTQLGKCEIPVYYWQTHPDRLTTTPLQHS